MSTASLPKPYYEDSAVRIFLGDNREIVPLLGRFDLLLTDPPYGINADANAHKNGVKCRANGFREYAATQWDQTPAALGVLLDFIGRCDNAIIWGWNYFGLPPSAGWLFWDKMQRDFSFADGELAWTNIDMALRAFDLSRGELRLESGLHPTQKPLKLLTWCLSFTPKARRVLDPYAGSGTTGRACKDLGLQCVLIEGDEAHCETAAKRMGQEVLNLT